MNKTKELTEGKPKNLITAREQIDLVKNTVAKGANDQQLKLFLYTAAKAGLDPLTKQIYAIIHSDGNMIMQTGIDGYRTLAERAGNKTGNYYAGSDDGIFTGEVEVKYNETVWQNGSKTKVPKIITAPKQVSVTVYRLFGNTRVPFTATARWSEYYPGEIKGHMWHKMPFNQLEKCAEAKALRKAFPNDMHGIYTDTEMEQSERVIELDDINTGDAFIQDRIAEAVAAIKVFGEYDDKAAETFNDIDENLTKLQQTFLALDPEVRNEDVVMKWKDSVASKLVKAKRAAEKTTEKKAAPKKSDKKVEDAITAAKKKAGKKSNKKS